MAHKSVHFPAIPFSNVLTVILLFMDAVYLIVVVLWCYIPTLATVYKVCTLAAHTSHPSLVMSGREAAEGRAQSRSLEHNM